MKSLKHLNLFICLFICWVLVVALVIFVAVHGLSSCGAWAPELTGSVVVVCGLFCSAACGILVP